MSTARSLTQYDNYYNLNKLKKYFYNYYILYIIYIIKYADDTVVIGLISDNNEKEYKSTIDYASHWCSDNFLDLNDSKTKEIIFDMRKNKNSKEPVIINNTSVALVQS